MKGYELHHNTIDIHLGIFKIPSKEVLHDNAINNTESMIIDAVGKRYLNTNSIC